MHWYLSQEKVQLEFERMPIWIDDYYYLQMLTKWIMSSKVLNTENVFWRNFPIFWKFRFLIGSVKTNKLLQNSSFIVFLAYDFYWNAYRK